MDDSSVQDAARHLDHLREIFLTRRDPYRAHEEARSLLEQFARMPAFLKAVLMQHLSEPETFNKLRKNPVLDFIIEDNERFTLVANCFLPRDDRDTQLSHQSVHHHGSLLLSTVALLGPGYETWNFTRPTPVEGRALLFDMSVTYASRHRVGNTLFIDAYDPHIVFYPEDLSVTLALWSHRSPVSWKTRIRRNPLLQRFKKPLRAAAQFLGLARSLDLNVGTLLDYYPAEGRFKALERRAMYTTGSNKNFLLNLFHIVQRTGNADLGELVDYTVKKEQGHIRHSQLVKDYSGRMKANEPIQSQFEECHRFLPYANLRQADVRGAVRSWAKS